MGEWTAFPHDATAYTFDAKALRKHWARLHRGDTEPLPGDVNMLAIWALFHAGEFRKAVEAGMKAGGTGITIANKAQAIYANYLEKSEETRLELFLEVAERAQAQIGADSQNANAHYCMAYALGRYGQSISVSKALTLGLPSKIKNALEATIKIAPRHADAHAALGAFHAEVIDKVGSLLGLTQGASKDAGLAMFRSALALNPTSAIAMTAYADGLVMLEGNRKMKEANELYEKAAACKPMDAMERLDVEMAKAGLAD